jgi:hypothetical protein
LVWAVLVGECFAQSVNYLDRLFPSGATMGLKGDQLRQMRKEAVLSPIGGNADPKTNYNLIERLRPATICWYYIRNNQLCGYMRTTKAGVLSPENQQAERDLILPSNDSGFKRAPDEQVLRLSQNLKAQVVTANGWTHIDSRLELYTVTNDQEITALLFDASVLSKEMFFVRPDRERVVDAQTQVIKEKVQVALTNSIGVPSNKPIIIATSASPSEKLLKAQPGISPWLYGIIILSIAAIISAGYYLFKRSSKGP